jgi:hypothetical protein
MKEFALYIKFQEKKIETLKKWEHILDNINYNDIDVYIWIYDPKFRDLSSLGDIVQKFINKYKSIKFITNSNQDTFLTPIEIKYLDEFHNNNSLIHQKILAKSHLKAFMVPKNIEYIFKLDGDDMFYPNFKVKYFYDIVNYMKSNKLKILTRPFWMCRGQGWSFGFTIAESNILEYIKPEQIKGITWKNLDRCGAKNLDNLFGYILICLYKIPVDKLFFKLKEYDWNKTPGWRCGVHPEDNYIHKINGIII